MDHQFPIVSKRDRRHQGDYGVDSLPVVATLLSLGLVAISAGLSSHGWWRIPGIVVGLYVLLAGFGMLHYSARGKLALRERLLAQLAWRGDEQVLDVGCGRGLLAVAAARRVKRGNVVGVDIWNQTAITGNQPASVLKNARIEGVADRVEVRDGDARVLPFSDSSFDVVVSNYVLHDLKGRKAREDMMREIARVLQGGGRVALVDFMFTRQCVDDLCRFGVAARRVRDERKFFWTTAVWHFGFAHRYFVLGTKA